MVTAPAASSPDRAAPSPVPHTPWGRVVAVGLAVAALVAVVVLAFSWPSVTAEPHDLPVAVAGPQPAVESVRAALDEQQPGAVDLRQVDDRDAAVEAIRTRDVYGAVVLGVDGTPEVLTASAASTATHQLMTGLAAQLQQQLTAQAVAGLQEAAAQGVVPPSDAALPAVTVTDVVPLSDEDPRGTGLAAALFPLVLGGMAGGIGISLAVIGAGRRILAVGVYAVVGGLVLTAIMQGWFGSLQGDWWWNAAAIALALAAIAAPITGLVAVLGRAGIAVGAVTMMLVANPISGATMPPEFLPWSWGAIGQWFPPGAGGTLLRDLSYFPDASAAAAWTALGLWAGAGVLLSLVGHFRTAGGAEPDAEALQDEALEHAAHRAEHAHP
ncbi:membrane protein [Isoptericola hypogeus]|uniref:Membrane protein n=1 Tax=Isoptericola hypogeus TaxID=300179 RepID=A0ABN2JI31_9MICO